ncbi:MAG: hypothetical protein IIA35_06625 [Proteobacteria bacterium]|nr:hypothetical protein [Pseudomonadota bacterium]
MANEGGRRKGHPPAGHQKHQGDGDLPPLGQPEKGNPAFGSKMNLSFGKKTVNQFNGPLLKGPLAIRPFIHDNSSIRFPHEPPLNPPVFFGGGQDREKAALTNGSGSFLPDFPPSAAALIPGAKAY